MNKETTIFIDTENMEERYANNLYKEYLKEELIQIIRDGATIEQCHKIIDYIEQLQNNWNELKEWLQERKFVYNITGEDLDEDTSITEVLIKVCEIESRK